MDTPLLETIFAKTAEGVATFQQDGVPIFVNASFLKIMGFPDSGVFEQFDLFQDPNIPFSIWETLFDRGEAEFECPYEFDRNELSRKSGVHPLSFRLIFQREMATVICFVENRTSEMLIQSSLLETEELFRIFSDGGPGGFFVFQHGRLIYANNRMEELTGRPLSDLLSENLLTLIDEDDYVEVADFAQRIGSGDLSRGRVTFRLKRPDGGERVVDLYLGLGRVRGENALVGVLFDVTDHAELSRNWSQAEKMSALGELAGGVAHDFNNLLMGISGYAEMLTKGLVNPRMKKYARSILREASRAESITENLLAFSRKEPIHRVRVMMDRVFAEMKGILTRALDSRIRQRWELRADHPWLYGDPAQVQAVILNVVLNARDAMPRGGDLLVRFEEDAFENPGAPGAHSEICTRVTVRDSGVGMDRETQEKIFEPFFTTKSPGQGTGLGLSSAFGMVQSLGGWIEVDSAPGEGSCFQIYFVRNEEDSQRCLGE